MDAKRLGENLNDAWLSCGAGDSEKISSVGYFYDIQKEAIEEDTLGENFCKLAAALNDNPWLLADDVVNNFEAFKILSKTASDDKSRQLAQFYMDWAEGMEKKAQWWRTALKGIGGLFGRGAKAAPKAAPRPTRAEMMKSYTAPGKGRMRAAMEGRTYPRKKVEVGKKARGVYQAPKQYSLGKRVAGTAALAAPIAGYMALGEGGQKPQPYQGQYYSR